MKSLIVDTHAHLDVRDFDEDRPDAISRANDTGVGYIITVGTDLESSKKAIGLSEQYAGVFAAVGVHPHDAANINTADIKRLGKIAGQSGVVAIGETGLDFHRNYSPKTDQIQALKWQLALSTETGLPVIIHCRDAEEDLIDMLRSWILESGETGNQSRGVIHCFSGDGNTAKEYLDMGFYLSLGGYIGYPSSAGMQDVFRNIPEDRLLVETDCPFLPPQDYRGKRNEPAYLPITVGALAEIRGESSKEVAEITTRNAQKLFGLPLTNN